jgi:hypothetical protein
MRYHRSDRQAVTIKMAISVFLLTIFNGADHGLATSGRPILQHFVGFLVFSGTCRRPGGELAMWQTHFSTRRKLR